MKQSGFILLLIAMVGVACADLVITPDAADTPVDNFNVLWREFDRYYAFFDIKHLDWDSMYSVYRPFVSNKITEMRLFNIMANLLDPLKDRHATLSAPFAKYVYQDTSRNSEVDFSLSVIQSVYLRHSFEKSAHNVITYGVLFNRIGYIHISNFYDDEEDYHEIDRIIEQLKESRSIIVDVRDNGGGYNQFAQLIASRFADRKRLYSYTRWRNGPEHGDLTAPVPQYIEPGGDYQYAKPVALLTNRDCFSTCETFVLAMRIMPHVTVFGDTTGGDGGAPLPRELPNGWIFQVPRMQRLTADGENFEGTGLPPDVYMPNTESYVVAQRDNTLRNAYIYLRDLDQ